MKPGQVLEVQVQLPKLTGCPPASLGWPRCVATIARESLKWSIPVDQVDGLASFPGNVSLGQWVIYEHTNFPCKINRSGQYFLIMVVINMCVFHPLLQTHLKLKCGSSPQNPTTYLHSRPFKICYDVLKYLPFLKSPGCSCWVLFLLGLLLVVGGPKQYMKPPAPLSASLHCSRVMTAWWWNSFKNLLW